MPEPLYALALLACPLSMGLMMLLMNRSHRAPSGGADARAEPAALQAEVERLQEERSSASPDLPVEPAR